MRGGNERETKASRQCSAAVSQPGVLPNKVAYFSATDDELRTALLSEKENAEHKHGVLTSAVVILFFPPVFQSNDQWKEHGDN